MGGPLQVPEDCGSQEPEGVGARNVIVEMLHFPPQCLSVSVCRKLPIACNFTSVTVYILDFPIVLHIYLLYFQMLPATVGTKIKRSQFCPTSRDSSLDLSGAAAVRTERTAAALLLFHRFLLFRRRSRRIRRLCPRHPIMWRSSRLKEKKKRQVTQIC